jgi:hypothetical protein
VPYGRGSTEGPRKPWDKWCKILHSCHFLAAKLNEVLFKVDTYHNIHVAKNKKK